jgi:thiol-disulfide isomerase/thioredoxin
MFRIRLLLLISLSFSGFIAMAAAGPVSLQFEIKGMPDGYCKLYGVLGATNYLVDSFPASKEKAVYEKNELLKAGLYYFLLPKDKGFFQFLIDKDQQMIMKTDTADFVKHMKVIGSEDNELFYGNLVYESHFRAKVDSVDALIKSENNQTKKDALEASKEQLLQERKKYLESLSKDHPSSFFTYFKMAGQNPELQYPKKADGTLDTALQTILYRDAYWKNTPVNDEKLVRTPVVANKLKTYVTQLLPQSADSIIKYTDPLIEQSRSCPECIKFIVNWIAIQYQKPAFMGGEKILVHLADKYYTDEIAAPWFKENPYELTRIRLKVNDLRASLIGETGQDLRCRNLDGQYENLYDLKTPLKIVFLYNPDCSHCQEQTPQLKALVERWKGKVDVYALCLNKDENEWRKFVQEYHTESFHNVIDPKMESLYYKKYHFENTPGMYVLDEHNTIVAKDLHPNQLDDVFDQVLNKAR